MNKYKIALTGIPNVGKSTIFNTLTKSNQHTGNWPGKTVCNTSGIFKYKEHFQKHRRVRKCSVFRQS